MTTKNKPTLAIIDSDGLLFYAAWSLRDNLTKFAAMAAKEKVDQIIKSILKSVKADFYIGFYGIKSSNTFRHKFATIRPYKGARKAEEWQEYFKPIIKEHYKDKWEFYGVDSLEADDAVIIAYHEYKDNYNIIMVGEDKDMLQLGEFTQYNPRDNKFRYIKYDEGRKFFWSQMIMGDSSDNITGIEGQGKKSKLINDINTLNPFTEETAFNIVRDGYINKYGEDYLYNMLENYIMLTMIKIPSFDYPKEVVLKSVIKEKENILKKLNI
jgi:5'-3' exonuclease